MLQQSLNILLFFTTIVRYLIFKAIINLISILVTTRAQMAQTERDCIIRSCLEKLKSEPSNG